MKNWVYVIPLAVAFLSRLGLADTASPDPGLLLRGGRLKLEVSRSVPAGAATAPPAPEEAAVSRFVELVPPDGMGILLNLGAKAWDLVVNNQRPIGVQFENLKAHALPAGVSAPMQLSPWAGPTTHNFKLEYENLLGMTMFSTEGGLQFYYGAPYRGRGQHISNLTVVPVEITARIGFTGNVKVSVSDPVYKEGQVASLIVTTQLDLRGPLDNLTQSQSFEIKGNGEINELN